MSSGNDFYSSFRYIYIFSLYIKVTKVQRLACIELYLLFATFLNT